MSSNVRPYLVAWRLDGRRVIVVGGGNIGTAKVETLLNTGATIVVIDPTPTDRVRDLADQNRVVLRQRRVRPRDLVRATLVVAATGDSRINRRVRRWAKPFGAVVNSVDDVGNCDVTVPAVIHRGPATIAITTGGATPAGARFLREELTEVIAKALPAEVGGLLEDGRLARQTLRQSGTYRYDYPAWRQHFFEPGINAIRAGNSTAVGDIRRSFEASFATNHHLRRGRVTVVGSGPDALLEPDDVGARAREALTGADVVVYDRLVHPGLLDLAPPAAERIPVGPGCDRGATPGEIERLMTARVLAGDAVVRLNAPPICVPSPAVL